MTEDLKSLKDIQARFEANESDSPYGLQLDASITVPLDITISHVPVLDADGGATGRFTDKCIVQLTGGFDSELRGVRDKHGLSEFLSAYLQYNNDSSGEQGVYLEDIVKALHIDAAAPVWTIADTE